MSGDDESMEEILGKIRTLSRGETPPRNEPQATKVGHKAWILVLPAMAIAYLLFALLDRRLGLSPGMFGDLAMLISLLMIPDFVAEARPADRRHWAALAGAVLLASTATAVTAAGISWLIARLAPEYSEGVLAAVGLMLVCAAAVLLILWSAHRLTRAENLFFPSDANEMHGDAG